MRFRTISIEQDKDLIIENRLDSFKVSFGDTKGFGHTNNYIHWVKEKKRQFPEGFVIVEKDGISIGQLELQVRYEDGKRLGYVNLYYLKPDYRNKGYGARLHDYAEAFFRKYQCQEYQLRVSPTNIAALRFYDKCGLKKLKEEMFDVPVFRMYKKL